MKRMLRRFGLLVILFGFFCGTSAEASAISGQSYAVFYQYYQENVDFINENDSRHLLPLSLANRTSSLDDGRLTYELLGDTLTVTILTDSTGKFIERCDIVLVAPFGMEYGNAVYNDFAISGYHSYALLMAMHADTDPARRYALVEDVVSGMAAGNGEYTRQVGVYTLTCTRELSTVTLTFRNNRIQTDTEEAAEAESALETEDEPAWEEDEGAGLL